jgi:hypothetical protein
MEASMTRKSEGPFIIIPIEHQAAPKTNPIKIKHEKRKTTKSGLIIPETTLTDTEFKSHLIVANSKIHGLGLFADKEFHQHDVIWRERLTGVIGQPEDEGPLRWTNHSDGPNSILLIDLEKIEVGLVALQTIIMGEEITYDYKAFGHTGYKARCNCSDINCPGFFTLREEWGERR